MIDNRNLILAVVLSIAILFGFEFYFAQNQPPVPPQDETVSSETAPVPGGAPSVPVPNAGAPSAPTTASPATGTPAPTPGAPSVPGGIPQAPGVTASAAESRAQTLAQTPRVRIETPRLTGSLSLTGGRLDDLTLATYRETLDADSPEITLLNPKGTASPYFADFGWAAQPGTAVPSATTEWKASSSTLTPDRPVTLTWDNGAGLVFKRTFAIDDNYMVTVTQSVANKTGAAVNLFPYGLISRHGTPETTDFYILHEGLLGVSAGQLVEIDYDDLQEQGQVEKESRGGWLGITDKYWLTALIPDQNAQVKERYTHRREGLVDVYQVDYLGSAQQIAPGQEATVVNRLFAGAKEVKKLDAYEQEIGIERFDLAIDWGWFYFLTRPIFYGLLWINDLVGNFGVAILLLTVGIKLIFFPLANKSYKSMSKMKKIQPQMTKLRERYADDKMKLNQEMMALYKKEGANPASGCLPILVQIPVFFALYKVLFVTIEMRHAPFFGWIEDLSAKDPTSLFTLFGLIDWPQPDFLQIGIWPLVMGATMYLQQKLNPQPPDPVQAKIFLFLPVVFTFILAPFPAGLVIYWTWNNLLSILQQWVIMRRMGVKIGD